MDIDKEFGIKRKYVQVGPDGEGDYVVVYDDMTPEQIARVDAVLKLQEAKSEYARNLTFANEPGLTFEKFVRKNFLDEYFLTRLGLLGKFGNLTWEKLQRKSVIEKIKKEEIVQKEFERSKEEDRKHHEGWKDRFGEHPGLIQFAEKSRQDMLAAMDEAEKILGSEDAGKLVEGLHENSVYKGKWAEERSMEQNEWLKQDRKEEIEAGKYILYEDYDLAEELGVETYEISRGDLVEESSYDYLIEEAKNDLHAAELLREFHESYQKKRQKEDATLKL